MSSKDSKLIDLQLFSGCLNLEKCAEIAQFF